MSLADTWGTAKKAGYFTARKSRLGDVTQQAPKSVGFMSSLGSVVGPLGTALSAGGGNPYLTAASIFGPMVYEQLKGPTEAEKRAAQWQQQREQVLAQAQQMALPLARGQRTRQQIEDAQRRSAQVAQASLGRGTGGAAFQRGVTEATQRTEGELASQQEQQNRMMGLQMLQGVQQQMPGMQQYYQQTAAGEAMQRGKRFDDIKALALHDSDTQNLIKALVKAGGKDGLASWLQKIVDGSPTSFDSKSPPKWSGSSEMPSVDADFINEILDRLGLTDKVIKGLQNSFGGGTTVQGSSGLPTVTSKSGPQGTQGKRIYYGFPGSN